MKYLLLAIAILCVAYVVYESVRISRLVSVSSRLVAEAKGYSRDAGTRTMLVLGDSTAVGVGAAAENTVAGRLAAQIDASVENYAVSGSKVVDIAEQFAKKKKDRYDIVLIQIGANDIIQFSPLEKIRDDIALALKDSKSVSDRVVVLTAGRVGNAPLFPHPFKWILTQRAKSVRSHFVAAAKKYDAAYVDLFNAKDPFGEDPARYYAPDGLHLSADGYGFWYEETRKVVDDRWPEL